MFERWAASNLLDKGSAEEICNNKDMFDKFMDSLEKKLMKVPVVGTKLSDIPVMAEMLKLFITKKYLCVPTGTIVTMLAALMYFVSAIDLIPDFIPLLGYLDDAAVVSGCAKYLAADDIKEFKAWRSYNIR